MRHRAGRLTVVLAALLAAVATAMAPATATAQTSPGAPLAAPRVLVLPFENKGREPRVFWLGEGSSVLLTDDLMALGVGAVSRDERLRAFASLGMPAVASLSHASAIRLGQAQGAVQVIIGDFELSLGQLVVRARAIALDTGRIGPEIAERGPLTDLFGVYARVARRLAPDSRVTLEQMEQAHPPLTAFEVYVKGLLAEAPATQISFLNQALGLAPAFQQSRIALWHAHADQNDHQRALAVIRQVPAEHRQGRQAQFLASISLLALSRFQESFDAMNALLKAAPDAAILNNMGVVQLRRPIAAPGRSAVAFFEEARRLNPSDPDILFNVGYAYWRGRDVVSATNWLRESVRRVPTDAAARLVLGAALQAAGNTTEAAREKEAAKQLAPDLADTGKLERLKTELAVVESR
jgi:tetratricopeptide (TPR) repeat protein